jgi:hypothetical protein
MSLPAAHRRSAAQLDSPPLNEPTRLKERQTLTQSQAQSRRARACAASSSAKWPTSSNTYRPALEYHCSQVPCRASAPITGSWAPAMRNTRAAGPRPNSTPPPANGPPPRPSAPSSSPSPNPRARRRRTRARPPAALRTRPPRNHPHHPDRRPRTRRRHHPDLEDRARLLRTDISVAGLASVEATLELALCFHHAVHDARNELAASISRLRGLTQGGDYAYYVDIAHFMASLPLQDPSPARWLDGQQPTRQRWHALVTARRNHLRTAT